MNYEEMANLKMYSNDLCKVLTIKEYFKEILLELWIEGEEFSGKRPFGNSGWDYDVLQCLIKNDIVKGKLDEDGYVDEVESDDWYKIVAEIIKTF